jgi:hypothetical protein
VHNYDMNCEEYPVCLRSEHRRTGTFQLPVELSRDTDGATEAEISIICPSGVLGYERSVIECFVY